MGEVEHRATQERGKATVCVRVDCCRVCALSYACVCHCDRAHGSGGAFGCVFACLHSPGPVDYVVEIRRDTQWVPFVYDADEVRSTTSACESVGHLSDVSEVPKASEEVLDVSVPPTPAMPFDLEAANQQISQYAYSKSQEPIHVQLPALMAEGRQRDISALKNQIRDYQLKAEEVYATLLCTPRALVLRPLLSACAQLAMPRGPLKVVPRHSLDTPSASPPHSAAFSLHAI